MKNFKAFATLVRYREKLTVVQFSSLEEPSVLPILEEYFHTAKFHLTFSTSDKRKLNISCLRNRTLNDVRV